MPWGAIIKAFLKSKAGKETVRLAIFLLVFLAGLLVMLSIVMFSFWNQFLCKTFFSLFNDDCKVEEEVLVYEPVTEEDVIELGKRMQELRDEANMKVVDPVVRAFLDSHGFTSKTNIDVPGEAYRDLPTDGIGSNGSGGGSFQGGNFTGEHVYNSSYDKDVYFQWALDAAAQTGWHPIFIFSQWVLETGHFKSNNFMQNNNIAGQTWHPGLPESMKGTARPRGEGGYYIRYNDAVEGYVEFVHNNPRYSNVKNFSTPEEQAAEVARRGWAADPSYTRLLNQLIQQYKKQYGHLVVQTKSADVLVVGGVLGDTASPEATDNKDESKAEIDGNKIAEIAEKYWREMGEGQPDLSKRVRYVMGGDNLKQGGRADCSDFSQAVYKEAGINIAGVTHPQMFKSGGEFVDGVENLKPGDLVFFNPDPKDFNPSQGKFGGHGYNDTYKGQKIRVSHVGVYVGGGQFIHLSYGNGTINKSSLSEPYFAKTFIVGKRWTEAGTDSYQMEQTGPLVNEAEIHLRTLNQADLHALNALELTPETLKEEPFKDKKIYKAWLVAQEIKKRGEMGIQPYADVQKRAIEAEKDGVGQDWLAFNWILYTQHEAYKCYMVGDERGGNLIEKLWEFFKGIFGLGETPCATLDELYQTATGDKDAVFIPEEDRGKLKHQHAIIEEVWICVPNETEESADGQTASLMKKWAGSIFEFYDVAFAHHLNEFIPAKDEDMPDCGPNASPQKVKIPRTYVTYQSLVDILYDFEPYAMFETGVTVDKKDGTYKDLIDFILGEMYRSSTGSDEWMGTPSGDFIVPMELGTYNFSSGFRGPGRPDHNGIDMGTAGVKRVPVYASAAGVVLAAGHSGTNYGSIVTIDHKNGMYSMYAHFWADDIVVRPGQVVKQGQLIGGAGNDTASFGGAAPAWHLHFEICKAVSASKLCKQHEDPTKYVTGLSKTQKPVAGERANEFVNSWKQKAKNGEIFMMPGFTPKEESEEEVKQASVSGVYQKDEAKGSVLGPFGMTEKEDSIGTLGNLYPFGTFLQKEYPTYYKSLSPYDPSSQQFIERWKQLSLQDPIGFVKAQKEFIEKK